MTLRASITLICSITIAFANFYSNSAPAIATTGLTTPTNQCSGSNNSMFSFCSTVVDDTIETTIQEFENQQSSGQP